RGLTAELIDGDAQRSRKGNHRGEARVRTAPGLDLRNRGPADARVVRERLPGPSPAFPDRTQRWPDVGARHSAHPLLSLLSSAPVQAATTTVLHKIAVV